MKKLLILSFTLFSLSGCGSIYTLHGLELRHRGTQIQEIIEDLQEFFTEEVFVSDSNGNYNYQCLEEINTNFLDTYPRLFLEYLLFVLGSEDVVGALHRVSAGRQATLMQDIQIITSVEIDPTMYETSHFYSFLENISQEDIERLRTEINQLKEVWNNCVSGSSVLSVGEDNTQPSVEAPGSPTVTPEYIVRETLTFWRDHMISINNNQCQTQIKAYLDTTILLDYVANYYFIREEWELIPEDANDIQLAINTMASIRNGCMPESVTSDPLDIEAEAVVRSMFSFWITTMIPYPGLQEMCQDQIRNFVRDDVQLSTLMERSLSTTDASLTDGLASDQGQFITDMRNKLDEMQRIWDSCSTSI